MKAQPRILLSELGILIFVIEWSQSKKEVPPISNFNEAFTEVHLGQLLALFKCMSGDRGDGRID